MPKIVDRQKKQAEILDAARRIFVRRGFRKATLQAIAEEAGTGKATLYYYFENKREILRGILEQEHDQIMASLQVAMDGIVPGPDSLRTHVLTRMRHVNDRIGKLKISDENLQELFPMFWQEWTYVRDALEQELIRVLQEGVDCGQFVIDDIPLTARVIDVTMRSLTIEFYRGNNPGQMLKAAQTYVDCLLGDQLIRRENGVEYPN